MVRGLAVGGPALAQRRSDSSVGPLTWLLPMMSVFAQFVIFASYVWHFSPDSEKFRSSSYGADIVRVMHEETSWISWLVLRSQKVPQELRRHLWTP
ncbi:MAG TPA: hypothetical protein VFW65_15000 [Pseudonocardiaceae bacterium]|nr:hypothetical protein [Pseudonocardiaceae bacterium]